MIEIKLKKQEEKKVQNNKNLSGELEIIEKDRNLIA